MNGKFHLTDARASSAARPKGEPRVLAVVVATPAEWARLPLPLTEADRAAGYWWDLSMRQMATACTLVFDRPGNGRAFLDALVADHLDLGRPDQIELIFGRKILPSTTGVFATRVVTRGVDVSVNALYRHSRVKQYFKEGRALRIETVVNDPGDLGCRRRLEHLDELQAKARELNERLLHHERVGQGCVLASPAQRTLDRAVSDYVSEARLVA